MFYKASRNQTIIRTGSIKPSVNFDQDDTSKVPQILKPPHSLHAWSAGPHEWGETLSLVDGVPPPVRWEHKSQHLPWHIKQRIYKADKKITPGRISPMKPKQTIWDGWCWALEEEGEQRETETEEEEESEVDMNTKREGRDNKSRGVSQKLQCRINTFQLSTSVCKTSATHKTHFPLKYGTYAYSENTSGHQKGAEIWDCTRKSGTSGHT